MRKGLVLLVLLTGCGTAAMADGGYPGTGTTTTEKPDHHVTTTTEKPDHVTTTKPPHTYPTTTEKPHHTTTTIKHTTTTAAATTTTVKQTTTTTAGGTPTTTVRPTTTTTTTTPGGGGTTTTSISSSTTTTPGGGGTTTTTFPPMGQFGFNAASVCPPSGVPSISITFGSRADLNGQTGTLEIIAGPSETLVSTQPLTYQSNQVVLIPYPALPAGSTDALLRYSLAGEVETAIIDPPLTNCATTTTSTTSTTPTATTTTSSTSTTTSPPSGSTTTSTSPPSSSTTVVATTTSSPSTSTTTLPLALSGATTVCRAEVPTIVINFGNTFPELAGRTGTLTMADINGNVVSTQPLVYRPNTTVEFLYPGTRVNPDGSIADVPGWTLQPNGLWVHEPSDAFLREGIRLTYTVNPTATAFITYPPESSACANPDNPTAPPRRPPVAPPAAPPKLPPTGNDPWYAAAAVFALVGGVLLRVAARRD